MSKFITFCDMAVVFLKSFNSLEIVVQTGDGNFLYFDFVFTVKPLYTLVGHLRFLKKYSL